MITGLDHVQLAMPEGEEVRARAFYQGLLGLTEVEKPPALAARGGCWFEGVGTIVHLGVQDGFIPAAKVHPAFTVRDLNALQTTLEGAGFAIVPDAAVAGVERFYAADPFGNRLEFIQDGQGFLQRSNP